MIPIKPYVNWLLVYTKDNSIRLFGSYLRHKWIYLQINLKNTYSPRDIFNKSILADDARMLEVLSGKLRFAENPEVVKFLETAYDHILRGKHELDTSEDCQP